ncbi:4'-phosphopantetheinyl transferase superfamily protein [Rathayibacter festucae]|uniref:4'-phosphopantetheinyl transferase family protein n=1 Tax=Rathayibacter festucae TaxID=110937 RepID=UPI001FB45F9B|nr:4'-phosphopantetheinyl transferase superfamily protein [Rathayibacter festucae]MCJ1701791.1 4'-phosphopantetheinyl transferase superfamily protein [Rathayibacter festucae]
MSEAPSPLGAPGLLAGLLPAGAAAVDDDSNGSDPPWPGEEGLIGAAVAAPSSRRQSIQVRACARRALALLGEAPCPLPRSPTGAPVWPEGIVGGLTHTDGYRAAVVARSIAHLGIGVDAERMRRLPDDLVRTFALPSELGELVRLRNAGHPAADALPLALFTAKEAAFKAWFPATGIWLGPTSADVVFRGRSAFDVVPIVDGDRRRVRLRGRWAHRSNLVLAVAWLDRDETTTQGADEATAGGCL